MKNGPGSKEQLGSQKVIEQERVVRELCFDNHTVFSEIDIRTKELKLIGDHDTRLPSSLPQMICDASVGANRIKDRFASNAVLV